MTSSSSPSPRDVVERYQAAWKGKDLDAARAQLHDDLSFQGPLDTFDNADDLIAALRRLAPVVKDVQRRKQFVDGQDVCEIYDLVTATPAGTAAVAEWYRVRGDKIAAIRVFFDARPFAPPAGQGGPR